MKTLKLAAISVMAFLSGNALAQGADQQALQKALSTWNPTEISNNNHQLVIALPGNSISAARLAEKRRRRSRSATRVVDMTITVFLFALLCEIH